MYAPRFRHSRYFGYHSMPSLANKFVNLEMRQQPYSIMQGTQPPSDYPYLNPYQVHPSYFPSYQGSSGYLQPQPSQPSYSSTVFHNPLQEKEEAYMSLQQPQQNGYPYMNPYPKGSFLTKPPSGMKTVLNSFKAQDGTLDINKMVDTAGQMINAVSQVSSVVKGFGGMFKA
ncbi:YppG family protein [Bacillus tuaregi]|uniref:YppG family protein n=1 Tax=Bacillus tuaregi TaxID=1816695 RepID=UPI0008F9319D|nr:YppG family protein [Bacillus tuaregi]